MIEKSNICGGHSLSRYARYWMDITSMDLLVNTCNECSTINILGFLHQLKWEKPDEETMATKIKCEGCGNAVIRKEKVMPRQHFDPHDETWHDEQAADEREQMRLFHESRSGPQKRLDGLIQRFHENKGYDDDRT